MGIEALQAVSGTIYLLTITAVGLRMLQLSRRTGKRPELLIGLSLLLGGTVGATLEAAGMGAGQGELGPAAAGRLLFAGKLFVAASLVCQCLFIRTVFRPGEAWSAALVSGILAIPAVAFAGFAASGTFATGELPLTWFSVELVGRVAASIWLVAEALRYYAMMKKRLALGLADPVVTNRFLLWAFAGLGGIVLMLTSVPPALFPGNQSLLMSLDLLVFACFGCAISIAYGLAFFPPARYLDWLDGGSEAPGHADRGLRGA